ncbi:hypothetical protein JCM3765_000460 [Sporobolomyces pararoseus]
MGKNSKKQRDQKRYYQELEARKEEDRLRKEEAKRSRSTASIRVTEPAQGGTIEDTLPALEDLGDWKEMDQNEREQNRGVQGSEVGKVQWQEGVEPKTLVVPEDRVARAAKAYRVVRMVDPTDSNLASDMRRFMMFAEVAFEGLSELEKTGFLYYLSCLEFNLKGIPRNGDSDSYLLDEANAQLRSRQLPLPRGVNRNELFIRRSGKGTIPWHEKPQSVKSSKELDPKLEAERKVNELRSENSELKSNLSALKAEVKEAYQARDRKEEENSELVKQISEANVEHKEKVEKLREENTKLKSTTPTSSPTSSSSSKSSFVVQALSKQVKDLSRELKEKNDQLAELITELTKSG